MTPFIVIGLGDFISEQGLDITVKSFANFYHNVTSKHQKRLELKLIDDIENVSRLKSLVSQYEVDNVTEILTLSQQNQIETTYKIASLIMLPLNKNVSNIVQESLSYSLPIICFNNSANEGLLDQTCSMQLDFETDEASAIQFSRLLKLLYFDREALKILKRGAAQKYESKFTWGTNNRARVGA